MLAITGAANLVTGTYSAGKIVDIMSNFENLSASSLPFLLLGNLLMLSSNSAASAPADMAQALNKAYQQVLDTYLPGEKIVSVDAPVKHEPTSAEGVDSNQTTIRLFTTDKDLTSYVNLTEVYNAVRDGKLPTWEQVYCALLDVIDMVDLGVFGDSLAVARLESHIKERNITITEKVSTKTEENPVDGDAAPSGAKVTGRVTNSYEQTTELSGEGFESKTIESVEAQNVVEQSQSEKVVKSGATQEFNQGAETKEIITTVKQTESMRVQRMDAEGNMVEVASETQEQILEETHQSRTIGVNQNQYEEERSWWQAIIGSEVSTTTHTFVRQDDKVVVYQRGEDGQMHKVSENADSEVLVNESNTSKDWKSGLVSYVPVVGSVAEIGLKYGHGYSIGWDDWVYLGMDAASVAVMCIPGAQGAGLAMMAGRTVGKGVAQAAVKGVAKGAAKAAGKAVVKSTVKGTAKAALKPQNALKNFHSHPGKVFSPERIKAKALTKAHNPMKEDILKTMPELHKIGSSSEIRKFLRKELAGDKGIANRLYKNYEYLNKNGYLTKDNLKRMSAGKSPINPLNSADKLHLDHIVPKSTNPAMKADPANLRFMPGAENMARGNRLSRHDLKDIKEVLQRYPNEPLPDVLKDSIREVLETLPGWQQSPFWQQVIR